MSTVLASFAAALRDLTAPRVLAILLVPPLAALLAWGALAWAFADDWSRWIADWIATSPWLAWISNLGLASVFIWASGIAAFALMLPVVLVTAVLVAEIVAMPVVVPWVAGRRFAGLERRQGGTVAGSALNSITAIAVFGVLWVATLPLWLTGIGALALPPLLSAFLNQRLFRYDALAEHAGVGEYRELVARAKGRLFLLGLLLALLYYVPVLNLTVPVLSALAYTHLCLAELESLRQGMKGA